MKTRFITLLLLIIAIPFLASAQEEKEIMLTADKMLVHSSLMVKSFDKERPNVFLFLPKSGILKIGGELYYDFKPAPANYENPVIVLNKEAEDVKIWVSKKPDQNLEIAIFEYIEQNEKHFQVVRYNTKTSHFLVCEGLSENVNPLRMY